MPRRPRIAPGGWAYHVLNRSVGKFKLFKTDKDFLAFQNLLIEAQQRHPIRLLAYCIMPTHWHFVVYPQVDGQLTAFFRWPTHTHAMRWRTAHRTVGFTRSWWSAKRCNDVRRFSPWSEPRPAALHWYPPKD